MGVSDGIKRYVHITYKSFVGGEGTPFMSYRAMCCLKW